MTSTHPRRAPDGSFVFPDFPEFKPNRSPEEVLRAGSFGGTYFRPIKSAVCPGVKFGEEVWKELPSSWIDGLDPETQICSSIYRPAVNKYKVKSGASLEEWEQSGWIKPQDPYGWFQWYCRFFQGRRTEDDPRQVSRWVACAGEHSGRWRNRLCNVVFQMRTTFDDPSASPVIRQTLLHWGYELTREHYMKWGAKQGAEVESPVPVPPRNALSKIAPSSLVEQPSRQKRVARKAHSVPLAQDEFLSLGEGKPDSDDEDRPSRKRVSKSSASSRKKPDPR